MFEGLLVTTKDSVERRFHTYTVLHHVKWVFDTIYFTFHRSVTRSKTHWMWK